MDYAAIEWSDGQPYSKDFDDVYFSVNDGRSESDYVFLQQNDLSARFATTDSFVIAETGFGTGLNFVLTLKRWLECAPAEAQLDYFGIDFAPLSPEDIKQAAACWPELMEYFAEFLQYYPLPLAGRHLCSLRQGRVRLHLVWMDVAAALQLESLAVDAWFLDGFSPAKNPQIWNQEVYDLIAQNSAAAASLATYSAAGAVRRGLQQAGFAVEKRVGHGNKREMIVARLAPQATPMLTSAPWYSPAKPITTAKQGVVIGAGLAGLAVAWALIRRGWTITLIDRHAAIAAEASGNPVGLVLPRLALDDSQDTKFYSAAFLHAQTRLNQLQTAYASLHTADLWHRGGVYCELPATRAQAMLARNRFPPDYLRSVDADVAPLKMQPDSRVFIVEQGGWASPARICAAMFAVCGDRLRYVQADVAALAEQGEAADRSWSLVSAAQKIVLESKLVVLANGIHAAKFSQTAWLPLKSARGQLTRLTLQAGVTGPQCAYSGEHYLAPSLDDKNSYYCGASYHLNDACTELRESDQASNLKFVQRSFPDIFAEPETLSGRTGFRAVSDDRMPIIGAVPDALWFENEYRDLRHGRPQQHYAPARHLSGLYISAAHGSRGMTSCFLSAEIIAAQIEGTPLPVAQSMAAALNPARFIIRRLKRGA